MNKYQSRKCSVASRCSELTVTLRRKTACEKHRISLCSSPSFTSSSSIIHTYSLTILSSFPDKYLGCIGTLTNQNHPRSVCASACKLCVYNCEKITDKLVDGLETHHYRSIAPNITEKRIAVSLNCYLCFGT